MNDQRISYGAKYKRTSVQRICTETAIGYLVRENWTSIPSASGSYGRLADERRLDFKILEILYRFNYLDFYFVYSSGKFYKCNLVCFSQTKHILGCLWCVKFSYCFLNQARASLQPARAWFLEIFHVRMSVCVFVSVPEAINN